MSAERLLEDPAADGACRICGCTDADCTACMKATGSPCWWIEPDLCSACALKVLDLDALDVACQLGMRDGHMARIPPNILLLLVRVARQPQRAACIHCMQEVAALDDVEAIRLHATTCQASPVVQLLGEKCRRLAQLQVDYEHIVAQLRAVKHGA